MVCSVPSELYVNVVVLPEVVPSGEGVVVVSRLPCES
jgi:hypothetical protein